MYGTGSDTVEFKNSTLKISDVAINYYYFFNITTLLVHHPMGNFGYRANFRFLFLDRIPNFEV